MATTTVAAPTCAILQNNQTSYFNSNGQSSPTSSMSPASPKMMDANQPYNPNPAKQLRPLKSPLYIPAVLRPTEHFPIITPMTPPKSTRGSLDNLEEQNESGFEQSDLDAYLSHMQVDEAELGEVTGPPKQDHWKPDEASTSCDSPQCKSNFNLFVRKHHCRHCGHIFCATHSSQTIPLDQEAQFHPDGYSSRACGVCYRQYVKWDTARSMRRKNSDGSSGSEDSKSQRSVVPSLPAISGHRRMMSSARSAKGGQQQHSQAPVANSVPKDWAWSTF